MGVVDGPQPSQQHIINLHVDSLVLGVDKFSVSSYGVRPSCEACVAAHA